MQRGLLLPNLQTNYTKDIEGKVELGRAVGLAYDVPIQSQLGFRTLFCLYLLPEMPMIDRASSALSLSFLSRLLLIHVHPNISMQVLYTVLYTFHVTSKENSSIDQELLEFAIPSFILMTLIFNSGVILLKEITVLNCCAMLELRNKGRLLSFRSIKITCSK